MNLLCIVFCLGVVPIVSAQDKKPNILIIWGDDIGQFNVSAYNNGMMGYKTPNIDRIAEEGAGSFNLDRVMEAVTSGSAGKQ